MRSLAFLAFIAIVACDNSATESRHIAAPVRPLSIANPRAVKMPITIISTTIRQWGPDAGGQCRSSADTLRAYDANYRWIDRSIISWSLADTTAYRIDSLGIRTAQRCFTDSLGVPIPGPEVTLSLCIKGTGCGA